MNLENTVKERGSEDAFILYFTTSYTTQKYQSKYPINI